MCQFVTFSEGATFFFPAYWLRQSDCAVAPQYGGSLAAFIFVLLSVTCGDTPFTEPAPRYVRALKLLKPTHPTVLQSPHDAGKKTLPKFHAV